MTRGREKQWEIHGLAISKTASCERCTEGRAARTLDGRKLLLYIKEGVTHERRKS